MTSTELKKRAIALAEKTKIDSVTPEEVGQLSNDIVEYVENVEMNGGNLGIRKTYTSVSAMESDSTSPKDDKGVLLRRGMLVNIYNQSDPESADNGKVFSFQNPGWAFRGTIDAGYATRSEVTELSNKAASIGYVTCNTSAGTAAKVLTVTGLTSLTTGIRLLVKMTYNNTASNATLNINGLGAKPLYYNNTRVSGDNAWEAGEIVDIYYDGTNFYSGNFQGGSGEGGNLILEWNTDAATTRKQVKQSDRKSLLQISYKNSNGDTVNEQYIGEILTDTEWEKDSNWEQIPSIKDVIEVKQSLNETLNISNVEINTSKAVIFELIEKVQGLGFLLGQYGDGLYEYHIEGEFLDNSESNYLKTELWGGANNTDISLGTLSGVAIDYKKFKLKGGFNWSKGECFLKLALRFNVGYVKIALSKISVIYDNNEINLLDEEHIKSVFSYPSNSSFNNLGFQSLSNIPKDEIRLPLTSDVVLSKDIPGMVDTTYINDSMQTGDTTNKKYIIVGMLSDGSDDGELEINADWYFNDSSKVNAAVKVLQQITFEDSISNYTFSINGGTKSEQQDCVLDGANSFKMTASIQKSYYWKLIFHFGSLSVDTDTVWKISLKNFTIKKEGQVIRGMDDIIFMNIYQAKNKQNIGNLVTQKNNVSLPTKEYVDELNTQTKQQLIEEIQKVTAGVVVSKWAGKKANFLGDSITSAAKYLNSLEQLIAFSEVRNYGAIGSKIAAESEGDTSCFAERYKNMDGDADLVCVFGGINDFWHGTAPLGTMDDREKTTFYGALHVLFSGLLNKYSNSKIFVITPNRTDISGQGTKTMEQIIKAITEVANYYCIPIFDLYNVYGWNPIIPVLKSKYIPDGVHPSDDGGVWIAERLFYFLDNV